MEPGPYLHLYGGFRLYDGTVIAVWTQPYNMSLLTIKSKITANYKPALTDMKAAVSGTDNRSLDYALYISQWIVIYIWCASLLQWSAYILAAIQNRL